MACGSLVGVGGSGGIAPWLPTSLCGGGRGARPSAQPPSRRWRITSRCTRSAGVVGLSAALRPAWRGGGAVRELPLQGAGQGAGGPGAGVASVRPSALPGRATLRASLATPGPLARGPQTAPVRCGAPPPGVARALVLRAGVGSPACRDPRGGRQWGARGRAARRSSCVPLPGVTVLSGQGGTPPRPQGG